jgi:hypothetical protein
LASSRRTRGRRAPARGKGGCHLLLLRLDPEPREVDNRMRGRRGVLMAGVHHHRRCIMVPMHGRAVSKLDTSPPPPPPLLGSDPEEKKMGS